MKPRKRAKGGCTLYTSLEVTTCHGNVCFTLSNEAGDIASGYVPIDIWRASVKSLPPPDNVRKIMRPSH